MPFQVRFHRLAAAEARRAERHYRARAIDRRIAERFRAAVQRAVERIASDPMSLAVLVGSYRSIRVLRFPYRLVFLVEEPDLVVVLAVAHTSRRTGYWQRRRSRP